MTDSEDGGAPVMDTEVQLVGDTGVVRVVGEVDAGTGPRLAAEVEALQARGARNLVFDCSGVTFMDSTGLRAIIAADLRAHRNGGIVTVRRPSANVRRVMEVTGIAAMIADR